MTLISRRHFARSVATLALVPRLARAETGSDLWDHHIGFGLFPLETDAQMSAWLRAWGGVEIDHDRWRKAFASAYGASAPPTLMTAETSERALDTLANGPDAEEFGAMLDLAYAAAFQETEITRILFPDGPVSSGLADPDYIR